MKRIAILLLLCAFLCGCAETASTESTGSVIIPESIQITEPDPGTTPEIPDVTYQLYLPNANADGFDAMTIRATEITADLILAELQYNGVLPDTVVINSFESKLTQLNIDFNRAFADLVCSMGTAGEMMIIGSVVNTFLSAFQAESVYITVDLEILESGHVIYDTPITFIE